MGTIGLHCIDLIRNKFTSSDENPFNKECFNRTAKLLKVKGPEKKCELIVYESKNASAMVQVPNVLSETDLVIVDPPRKGLDPEVVMALCRKDTSVKSLVYVSCGFDAFCRDFESLTTSGVGNLTMLKAMYSSQEVMPSKLWPFLLEMEYF